MKLSETFCGFTRTLNLLGHGKDKQPYQEKKKDKRKKKDYSDLRKKKRDWE